MIVDSSALMAVFANESEGRDFHRLILATDQVAMSAVTFHETSTVLCGRHGSPSNWRILDEYVSLTGIRIVPYDEDMAKLARLAFLRFGKGRHPAGLNMGDCAAYAVARIMDMPLLFKGNDFALTDIVPAARA